MNKIIAVAGLGAAIALGSLVGAGTASAYPFSGPQGDRDASAYWVDVSPFDHRVTVETAGQFGNNVCMLLTNGQSEGAVIAELADGDSSQVSDWTYVVHAAEWHFCPSYY